MDYSQAIAEALSSATVVAEVHKSTTQRGNRYRVYTFNTTGDLQDTFLVGIEASGKLTDDYRNIRGSIKL